MPAKTGPDCRPDAPVAGGFRRPDAGQNADTPHPSQFPSLRESGLVVNERSKHRAAPSDDPSFRVHVLYWSSTWSLTTWI